MKAKVLTAISILTALFIAPNKSDACYRAPPAAPTNLTATTYSGTRIDLRWYDYATNESGFQVYRKENNGSYHHHRYVSAHSGTGWTTWSDIYNVNHSTRYTYKVRAYISAHSITVHSPSAWTNEAQALTTVPDVVGVTETGAGSALNDDGLTVGNVTYECSDTVPKDDVISQDPIGGTPDVLHGSSVDLEVSDGQPSVPDVVGMSRTAAESAINAVAYLSVGTVTSVCSSAPVNQVLTQTPSAGPAACGTAVDLEVSDGQPSVPDVVGMSQSAAEAAIAAVEYLSVGVVTMACSDTVPTGDVISQDPAAGVTTCDDTVDLVVSLGQPVVPDIVGETEATAEAAIAGQDLVPAATYKHHDTVPLDNVISQFPAAGTVVLVGSTVEFRVSEGQPVVPPVEGATEGVAVDAIEDEDLVATSTYEHHDTISLDIVISQNPASGTTVSVGSAVGIEVSLGQPSVPDMVGGTESYAVSAIAAADLTVGNKIYEHSDTIAKDVVISQDPAAGTVVTVDSAVNLEVSLGGPIVPDVVGMAEATASSEITAAELTVGNITSDYSDTWSQGQVISQDPGAGTALSIGSPVDLVVSLGQPTVPTVVGESEENAQSLITGQSLTVGNVGYQYDDTVAAGTVIDQDPVSGTTVPVGSPVDIVVSLGENTPPSASWLVDPHAVASSSISMQADASDASGVEYYFQNLTIADGSHDTSWQDSSTFVDDGLEVRTEYSYRFKVRDKSLNQNETGWSEIRTAIIAAEISNVTQSTWHVTIQDAIDGASDGDIIEVPSGTYTENIQFNEMQITLTSTNPGDPGATTINGGGTGSVLTFDAGDADSEVIGFTITNGNASDGGGIYCNGASSTISNCVITGNDASGKGGGMYNHLSSPTVTNCTFEDNTAGQYGGGICNYEGYWTVADCQFNNNSSATYGGGMANIDDCYGTVTNCGFSDNFAEDEGGGMHNTGSHCFPTVARCIFVNNSCWGPGGGMYNGVYASPTVLNCVFRINISDGYGGGIDNYDAGQPQIVGCTFTGNYADLAGCGMSNRNGSTVNVNGCIFWDDTFDEIHKSNSDVSFSYCDIEGCGGSGSGWNQDLGTDVVGNIEQDPLLVAAGYHIQSGSPCINRGDPDYVPAEGETDIDGDWRIRAGRVDMGAHEYGKVIYVDTEAGGANDGSSWADAFNYLQDALALTSPNLEAGDEIWVADGTYKPDEGTGRTPDDQTETFQLVSDVALYGGFARGENSLRERDWITNKTILSGDIDITGDEHDRGDAYLPEGNNSYHVAKGADGAYIDGFIITGGNANTGSFGGGGMLNNGVSPIIRNCIFSANMADDTRHGAGVYNCNSSSPTLINCIFTGNWTTGDGSGMYNTSSDPTVINCTITANYAVGTAGGIYNDSGNPTISNCIIWDNEDSSGTGSTGAQISGGSPVVNYSCITNWSGGGTGNIGNDPTFVSPGRWIATAPADSKFLEATVRDFIVDGEESYHTGPPAVTAHPDFQYNVSGVETGIVQDQLGADGKPLWNNGDTTPEPGKPSSVIHSGHDDQAEFDLWYHDDLAYNDSATIPLPLQHQGDGVYKFRDPWFFPIDHMLFGKKENESFHYSNPSSSGDGKYHNFHFSLELHCEFTYLDEWESKFFEIYQSDDDMFIFINDGTNEQLVLDLGGIHSPKARYSFDLFYAERHTVQSHLEFSTSIPLEQPEFEPGDYHLQSGSPCIDAADNDVVPADVTVDLDGHIRFYDDPDTEPDTGNGDKPVIDMGAYEYPLNKPPVAEDDSATTVAGQAVTIDVLANDSDPDPGDALLIKSVTDPPEGTAEIDGTDIIYTPDGGFVGPDSFSYTIEDEAGATDSATVTVAVGNYLQVKAGEYEAIELPLDFVDLHGQIVGDPAGEVHTTAWSVALAPLGSWAEIDYPDQLDTKVTFHGAGPYVLRLTARDIGDNALGWDDAGIAVLEGPGPVDNDPPVVTAGIYGPVKVGELLYLDGTITDDGQPYGKETAEWSMAWCSNGGGTVTFYPADLEDTTARFSMPGDYRLCLKGSDGEYDVNDFTNIIKVSADPLHNDPPEVEAGSNTEISFQPGADNVVLNLYDLTPVKPSVTDDGLPVQPGHVTILWSQVSGPVDAMSFENDNTMVEHPKVTFTRYGLYELQLAASDDDGQTWVTDKVAITVNREPMVEAGEDKVATLPTSGEIDVPMTDADVTDRALPLDSTSLMWSVTSGQIPDTDYRFNGQETLEKPTVTFRTEGVYELELAATDSDYSQNPVTDTVTVTVKPTAVRSLYVANGCDGGRIGAYNVVGEQANAIGDSGQWVFEGYKPMDLAIDSDSATLFFSQHGPPSIGIVSARTMGWVGETGLPFQTLAGGIVWDRANKRLYTIRRGGNEFALTK
jgi:fibro-slime domain-containing protein